MSFNHTRVDVVERMTKAHIIKHESTVGTVDASDPPVLKVDNIPVKPELAQFCAEIRKINRHVKFGLGTRTKFDWRGKVNLAEELYVYMDGHTYAMMKVGHGDYSVRTATGSKYMVYARVINNEKFREDLDQYHMANAETVERAMKNVKKYMRPYAPIEVASMTFDSVRGKFSSVVADVSTELFNAKNDVLHGSQMRVELFHMIDVGYEFLSVDFYNKIVAWREKYNEDQIARGRALHAYYVNVRIHREEMMCDVIEVLDANKRSRLDTHMPVVTYKMEDLPEGIAGNLAALSMVEDDHYVDGVGLRVDSSTFWVQR